MYCWKCNHLLNLSINNKIAFRATCDACGADLHVCKQCRFHEPGRANECQIPGTDFISDRERANFCEEFSSKLSNTPSNQASQSQKRFSDLFKDENFS